MSPAACSYDQLKQQSSDRRSLAILVVMLYDRHGNLLFYSGFSGSTGFNTVTCHF